MSAGDFHEKALRSVAAWNRCVRLYSESRCAYDQINFEKVKTFFVLSKRKLEEKRLLQYLLLSQIDTFY